MEVGIMPHLIACRAQNPVKEKVREKISMYTNVPMRRVFSMHDVDSIYLIPEMMRDAGLDREVLTLLELHDRVDQRYEDKARVKWRHFIDRIGKGSRDVTIAVTGKYTALRDAYASVIKAIEHCGVHLGVNVHLNWLDTTALESGNVDKRLQDCHGIIVPGGFGVRGTEGKIDCIRYARENKVAYLGLCLGFQMAVIEYARNVCGIADANSSEFDPRCRNPVIDILPDQKKIEGLGGNMRLGGKDVELKPGTLVSRLFDNAPHIRLRFRHRYEVDPRFIATLEDHGLIFSGKHPSQPIMQVLELPQDVHPYFIGTQAHPELTSRPLRPNPFFMGLIRQAMKYAELGSPQPQAV
jgi:CTP synthase